MPNKLRIGFTGHRPDKIFYNHSKAYSENNYTILYYFINNIFTNDKELNSYLDSDNIYNTGGALGFDSIITDFLLNRLGNYNINLYLPYKDYGNVWYHQTDKDRLNTHKLKTNVQYVSNNNKYSTSLLFKRNEHIVNNSDILICLWNGSNSGTLNCINYAKKQNKKIINLWDKWKEHYDLCR